MTLSQTILSLPEISFKVLFYGIDDKIYMSFEKHLISHTYEKLTIFMGIIVYFCWYIRFELSQRTKEEFVVKSL